jgi:N-acetylneuraminate lyase
MAKAISGIIPALVTPFNSECEVDCRALRELVNHLVNAGVNGFYVCGSTGECFLLSDDERAKVMEAVAEETNGRVPIIAHVGALSTAKAAEYAKIAQSLGYSAVSSVPPFYYQYGFSEIARFYGDISSSADLPLIVYNIPALSGVSVNSENLSEITDACDVMGLKYTSYDLFELEKISRKFPEIRLYNGHDEVFANALPVGIDGAIGSTFNVMPQKYLAISSAYSRGDVEQASAIQHECNAVIEKLILAGVNRGIKYLLTKMGIPCGSCRPPCAEMDERQKKILDEVYESFFSEARL